MKKKKKPVKKVKKIIRKKPKPVKKELTAEERIALANKPGQDAMKLHPFFKGKIQIAPKCVIRDFKDFAIWYTPGVAKPCLDIKANPEKVWEHTNRANTIAVLTDGTRVLGLGDIGPEASLPVMEGKGLLFKYLGGVDVYPIAIRTKDPDEFIKFAKLMEPSFGGYNLEDIEQPKCFRILDTLRKEMNIPVWHDDQQGTAAVTVAGLINALKIVGKDPKKVRVGMIGAGAAGIACLRVMVTYGIDPAKVVMTDIYGIVHKNRPDFDKHFEYTKELMLKTNLEDRKCERVEDAIPKTMEGMDVVIGYSKPGPDTIKKEWIQRMAKDPILFVCANPVPEIWPWEAKAAGAKIVATGRSDFPNQVNNSLGFPGIFRGTLDVNARTITDEMCIAAAVELAKVAEDRGLREDYLIPTMDDWEVFPREAVAVGMKAIEQGVARITMTKEQLYKKASSIIKNARNMSKALMKQGFIPKPPKD
ncbi:MAG: NADP-dependent malic enzyme [Candidatus Latescibacteria bacterium]|nr:NADP-dependent malic enzyme [Candidatus Latescibacterota bacterium]